MEKQNLDEKAKYHLNRLHLYDEYGYKDMFEAGYKECQKEYEEKLQQQKEIILSIIGHGDPYPLETVLEKLKFATEYLLHVKNYDGHAHEELNQSVRRTNEILSILSTREAHFL